MVFSSNAIWLFCGQVVGYLYWIIHCLKSIWWSAVGCGFTELSVPCVCVCSRCSSNPCAWACWNNSLKSYFSWILLGCAVTASADAQLKKKVRTWPYPEDTGQFLNVCYLTHASASSTYHTCVSLLPEQTFPVVSDPGGRFTQACASCIDLWYLFILC